MIFYALFRFTFTLTIFVVNFYFFCLTIAVICANDEKIVKKDELNTDKIKQRCNKNI